MREHLFFAFGEIDIAEAPYLRDEVIATMSRTDADLALDFADMTFMDCAGVSVLIELRSRLVSLGRQFRLVHMPQAVRLPLDVLDLTQTLHVDRGSATAH